MQRRLRAEGGRGQLQEIDPERIFMLKECCDMLLAGGYFRARIPTLSPFDKVVGGICWSITASSVDLDVDILFTENATIGERIKLSENLIKALRKMNYGQLIEPHHIQGLDYDHLFPLIQWLVKRVLETRRLTGDLLRQFSEAQFDKLFRDARGQLGWNRQLVQAEAATRPEEQPDEDQAAAVLRVAAAPLEALLEAGSQQPADMASTAFLRRVGQPAVAPARKFRSRQGFGRSAAGPFRADPEALARRCEATLLEFDEQLQPSLQVDEEREEQRSGGGGAGKLAARREAEEQKRRAQEERLRQAEQQEAERLRQLRADMGAETAAPGQALSGSAVGSIVQLSAAEILRVHNEFQTGGGAEDGAPGEPAKTDDEIQLENEEQAHQRRVAGFRRRLKEIEAQIQTEKPRYLELEQQFLEAKTELEKREKYLTRVKREIAKLEEIERADQGQNAEMLRALKALVSLNEQLGTQEKQFKQVCKRQKKELLAELTQLQQSDADREEQVHKLDTMLHKDNGKLDKLRQVLAKRNQEISRLSREIDEIPTRAEMMQYERRFVELYELISVKLIETRKFYDMYNSLDQSLGYMNKETDILESIIKNYPLALKTKTGKQQILTQLSGILDGVRQNRTGVQEQLDQRRQNRDLLLNKLHGLIDQQRVYFRAVKEFQDQCTKNEKLSTRLEQLQEKADRR